MCSTNDGSNAPAKNANYDKTKGACCKVGSTNKACVTDLKSKYECSQPVLKKDNAAKWQNILTTTGDVSRNMQMIAFCPMIGHPNMCGIKDGNHKIELTAADTLASPKKITLTGKDKIVDSKGQSCHWALHAPTVDLGAKSKNCIHVKTTKVKNMEAYAYAGDSRTTATKPCHKDNSPLTAGSVQHYFASEGILLTALPSKGETDTEFEIEFWIGPTPESGVFTTGVKESSSNTGMIVILIIAIVMVVILAAVVMKMKMSAKAGANDV